MEFLDNLVLPQSLEHIELLHYMLMIILFLFIPFISIVLGSTILSLFYKRKGVSESNDMYLKFAKDVIELLTLNKSIGIILGMVPLFTATLIYAQLLHSSGAATVLYIIFSFLLVSVGLILIYTYRYSLIFMDFFNSVNPPEHSEINTKINQFKKGNQSLSSRSGKYGLLLLIAGLWLFVSGLTIAIYPASWGTGNLLYSIFSWKVLVKFLQFFSLSLALTGAAMLFGFFYWDGGKKIKDESYKIFIKNTALNLTLAASILIPVFLLINTLALPKTSLSGTVFGYAAFALLLIFIAYHLLYAMMKDSSVKFSGPVFYVILFSLLSIIITEQTAMANSTKPQSAVLSHQYEKYLADLVGESGGAVEVSGKEIYEVRCASCHRFDQKVVGPPYNQTLPKYEGNKNKLVAFIRNPVKVNPDYPPMPNPGLKPQEAAAVATYLLETYKK